MNDFDYNLHKIIGVARKRFQGDKHATIYPLGYQDTNFHFQPFTTNMQKNIFMHNGTVFGPNFRDHLINKLILLQIQESELKDDPTKDIYLADYNSRIIEYEHTPIINTDEDSLKEAIKQGNCDSNYYKIKNRIYHISYADLTKGIAKYWQVEDKLFEVNSNMCRCDDDVFLIRGNIDYPFGYSDIFTKDEIIRYIISLVKQYDITPENYIEISDSLIKTLGIPLDILKSRFDAFFKGLLPSIVLTHGNILDLASNHILSDVLQRSIKEYEEDYIKAFEDNYREAIDKIEATKVQKTKEVEGECLRIEKEYISNLNVIKEDIKAQELKLKQVIDKIKTKTIEANAIDERFTAIELHKERLIEDFSIIQDVIGDRRQNSPTPPLLINIQKTTSEGEEINDLETFCNHLEAHLLKNCSLSDDIEDSIKDLKFLSKNLARLFVATNRAHKHLSVIMLPNIIIFKSLIDAIGGYTLVSTSVGANWKSFDDLYNNGLQTMLKAANSNPKEIHILLLQHMNLSYIPSYMQPVDDILVGISNKLPGNHNITGIPPNLWIIGTRTTKDEEVIPISESNIKEYGCVKFEDCQWNIDREIEVDNKYITMDFVDTQRKEKEKYKSYPESYLN